MLNLLLRFLTFILTVPTLSRLDGIMLNKLHAVLHDDLNTYDCDTHSAIITAVRFVRKWFRNRVIITKVQSFI